MSNRRFRGLGPRVGDNLASGCAKQPSFRLLWGVGMRSNFVLRVLLASVFLALAACAPPKIPGTDLDDTGDTRAVLDVLQKYRSAVEKKDTDGLVKLIDESFHDDGGSATPEDDLDFSSIGPKISARLAKTTNLKLDRTVRRIEFDDDNRYARVTYSYQISFTMPDYTSRTQSENDIKQMLLKRVGETDWKITSGI